MTRVFLLTGVNHVRVLFYYGLVDPTYHVHPINICPHITGTLVHPRHQTFIFETFTTCNIRHTLR